MKKSQTLYKQITMKVVGDYRVDEAVMYKDCRCENTKIDAIIQKARCESTKLMSIYRQ